MTKTKMTVVVMSVISLLIISTLLNSNNVIYGTSKGLKVNVFINNADCIIGSEAKVRVDAGSEAQVKFVSIQHTNSVVNFQFDKGEVQNGDSIEATVTSNGQSETGSGSNGEQKAPEDINVNWNCNNNNQGGDQSSSSSSAATDGSAASSSSSSSKSCLAFC